MKKVLVLGANGQIARIVEDRILKEQPDVELTLFLR
ncbi:oxidoreductase, partial [Clostridium botulinum]|nr:oxidoreductase [Clostridium botulinum]